MLFRVSSAHAKNTGKPHTFLPVWSIIGSADSGTKGLVTDTILPAEEFIMQEKDEIIYRRYAGNRAEQDLRILFDRYRDGLMMFLYSYTANMDDAEELMMDTFAALASGKAKYREKTGCSFKTWLYTVGRNLTVSFLRKNRRTILSEEATLAELTGDPDSPAAEILREEQKRVLYLAMSQLKPEYREVLYLQYFEEQSREEIGRIMKKSIKQIYNLSDRGRRALREKLEEMGFDYGA